MTTGLEKLTPAMKQFHQFKQKYPDCILFFRMGDFYETFYEDAKTCSKVLGLTLTSRNKGDNPIPLAGVPYHAVDGYLKKMLEAGYKVAVCEQVEDPKIAKGVVKRDIVRIVTPGTLTDDILLDAKKDNFLCAISMGAKNLAAISWVDISTGHFFAHRAAILPLYAGGLIAFFDETRFVDDTDTVGMAVMAGHMLLKLIPKPLLVPAEQAQEFLQIAGRNTRRIGHRLDTLAWQRGQLPLNVHGQILPSGAAPEATVKLSQITIQCRFDLHNRRGIHSDNLQKNVLTCFPVKGYRLAA